MHNEGEGAAATTDAVWYKDLAIGVAYTVNDSLSISFNRYTSQRHNNGGNWEQETDAFNIGYTVGGMTIDSKMLRQITPLAGLMQQKTT